MNSKNNSEGKHLLQIRRNHRRWAMMVAILGILITSGTFFVLKYSATAQTYQKHVLDCRQISGTVSHIHNDDCYYKGELVCPLQEIQPHQHTEECWQYEPVLVCGLEESYGHQHTDACYIPVMELACGLEESEGDETHPAHQHSQACYRPMMELVCGLEETAGDEQHEAHWHGDACYAEVKQLVCGMEEGEGAHFHTDECWDIQSVMVCGQEELPVHVHGPECFRVEEMTEEEIAAMDAAAAERAAENEEGTEPADGEEGAEPADGAEGADPTEGAPALDDANTVENANDTDTPAEGQESSSVPENLADLPMQTTPFSFASRADNILVTVEAPAEAFPAGTEMKVRAIYDEQVLSDAADAVEKDENVEGSVVQVQAVDISFWFDGKEFEPMKPIRVVMTPVETPDFDAQTVVHVDDAGETAVIEQEDVAVPEAAFEVEEFSVYCLVYTKLEKTFLASDGNNYKITVTAPDDAPFTENAQLWVSEIEAGTNAYGITYNEYLTRSEYALGWEAGSASYVRLFDIFVGDQFGNKLTLTSPVDVKIELLDKEANKESQVVHFGAKTEVMTSETNGQTVSFETGSFSVFAIVENTITEYVLASDGQNYKISMTYGPEAGIPDNAELVVSEVVSGDAAEGMSYEDYLGRAERSLDDNQRVTFARFFDITIVANGAEVQPLAPVEVKIELVEELQDEATEEVKALHFYDDGGMRTIPTSVDTQTVSFNADGFSVYGIVGTKVIETEVLLSDGKLYTVTVNYDENANIPEGSTLRVSEYEEGTEEYNYARNSVLADKKAKGEYVNIEDFNLAALDISIIAPNGQEIEPEAPVQVDIKIKDLPGVEDLSLIQHTLEVQHHVETAGGVIVEKVFEGQTEGTFEMATDAKTASEGIAVDPYSVSEADFQVSYTEPPTYDTVSDEDDLDISFSTEVFSTFTITWGSTTNTSTNIRWRYNNNNTRGQITVRYVNNDGSALTRPNGIIGNYDISVSNGNFTNEVVFSADNVARSIDNRTYESAYIVLDSVKIPVTRVVASRSGTYSYSMSYYNGDTLVHSASGTGATNYTRPEVFLQYTNTSNDPKATVHYGYMNGNTFVEFTEAPSPTAITIANHAYLIYDFDGYTYADHTYYRTSATTGNPATNGTEIQARLQYNTNNSVWRYYTLDGTSGSSQNVANNSHIYVIYEPEAAATEGGTATTKPVQPGQEPPEPRIAKDSKENGDGTNTLSLSITGDTIDLEVEKLADVIVIFDVSGSMSRDISSNTNRGINDSRSRMYQLKAAVNSLADTLLSEEYENSEGEKLIRLSLVTFSNDASKASEFTDDADTFKDWIDELGANGGTNWEHALYEANIAAVDPERATFVIFVTDGEPTFRVSRMGVSNADLDIFNKNGDDDYYVGYNVFGTGNSDPGDYNYNAALEQAQSIVSHKKNLYTIGVGPEVGNLTEFGTAAGAKGNYTATTSAALTDAFDEIVAEIAALLGWGDINMTDGITDLSNTVMESASLLGVNDDFTYWKAPAPAGWSDMTAEQKAAYKPSDGDFVQWDPSSERCLPASYNTATGAVEWHMGPNFVLQDGCTYKVSFSVWPSQEAYDWIAALKNGTKTWNDVVTAGLDYPNGAYPQIKNNGDGSYSLATNKPGANTTYKSATKTGDTVSISGDARTLQFNTVDPMGLAQKQITVRKRFAHTINSASPLAKIEFTLLEGGVPYKNAEGNDYKITLPKQEGAQPDDYQSWEDTVYIAPGLIQTMSGTPGYRVLENGHDYSLTEKVLAGDEFEYKFTPQIVRPMVVGTELKYFVKKDAEYNTNPDGKTEYTIEGGTYYELGDDAQALTGTNRKTAELDITKKVVDATGRMTQAQLNAETFTYKITLTVPEGADKSGIMGYEYVPRPNDTVPGTSDRPRFYIFGYQGEAGGSPFSDDVAKFGRIVYGGWNAQVYNMFGDSNTVTFYMTLDNDELIRLTNLPQGTTYTITEYYANVNASDRGAPSPSSDLPGNVAAQGYTVTVKQDGSQTPVATDTITGTINELDKRYYNQFTNTLGENVELELKARKHLDGYTWSNEQYFINLTTETGNPLPGYSGRTRFYRQFAAGSAGDIDQTGYTFGKIRFTAPGTYKYYIAEDDPGLLIDGIQHDSLKTLTIVITEDPVTHVLSVESVTGDDTTWDSTSNTAMTTITNKRITASVKVLKIGNSQTTNPLAGVKFELYSKYVGAASQENVKAVNAVTGQEYGTLITETDGDDAYFVIDGLLPSQEGTKYYLVETEAKSGYNLLVNPVEITVYLTDAEPYYEVSYLQTDYSASSAAGRIEPDEDGNCVIIINNFSGTELPMTGGPGVELLETIGGIMMAAAFAVLVIRRRRMAS